MSNVELLSALKSALDAGVSLEEIVKQWEMFPDQNLDVLVGGLVGLKNGQGQERNMPFQNGEVAL